MYTPSREHVHGKAADVLRSIDNQIDDMLESWTQIVLTNLEDPTTQGNLELLQADDKEAIQNFLATREFQLPINPALVNALKQVFGGLIKISVSMQSLESALQSGGPAKVDELKQRFAEHVDSLVRGKDPNKIRIVLE